MKFFHYRALSLAVVLTGMAWLAHTLFDYFHLHQQQFSFWSLLTGNHPAQEYGVDAAHKLILIVAAVLLLICFVAVISYYLRRLEQSETWLNNIFNNVIPICVTDNSYRIIRANDSYLKIFGPVRIASGPIMCHDSRPGPKCKTEECPLLQISQRGKNIFTCESTKTENDIQRHFIVTATPLLDHKGHQTGIIESFQDITPRIQLEKEKEQLIQDLRDALLKVKLLSGFLPICASCKKIRDDKGYWTQIETYIRNHSEAEFSHGICPDCAERLYGKYLPKE